MKTSKQVIKTLIKYSLGFLTIISALLLNSNNRAFAVSPNCSGYPESRVFIESQSWWKQTPGKTGTDFGHLHVGTCFPYLERISGTIQFDVRIIMHENPGVLTKVEALLGNRSINIGQTLIDTKCEEKTCVFWYALTADTSGYPNDGLQQLKIRAKTLEPDGNTLIVSNSWPLYLSNGAPVGDEFKDGDTQDVEGRGWYGKSSSEENFGYINAHFKDVIPMEPLAGDWKFTFSVSDDKTTRYMVLIDPAFHAGNSGIILQEGNQACKRCSIVVDTTQLTDGDHKLVIRADADLNVGSTMSGLLVIPFTVANAGKTFNKVVPVADTFVDENNQDINYGRNSTLEVDGESIKITYIKFDLSKYSSLNITKANLSLAITNSSSSIQDIYIVPDSSWLENDFTYRQRPLLGDYVTSLNGGKSGTYVSINLLQLVQNNSGLIFSIAITSTGSDGLDFLSRESVTPPILLLEATESSQTPSPTGTPYPTSTPTSTPEITPTTIPSNTPIPDTESPVIFISFPTDGATLNIKNHKTILILVNAQDNIAIHKVIFLVNKKVICEDFSYDYSCSWRSRGKIGNTYILEVIAYDLAGNSAMHSISMTTSK